MNIMSLNLDFIVDSHQHFWVIDRGDYNWLTPAMTTLYKDFLPVDYLSASFGIEVRKTILVQAAESDDETDFILQLASENPIIGGVVGWVDMESGAIDVCRRLDFLSKNALFKGIRPMLQNIKDVDWILNPLFEPIFEKIISLNLTFDALVFTHHLENILILAKRHPSLKIVIDHCAKPDIANQDFDAWAHNIALFKNEINVYVKISGLSTEAASFQNHSMYYERYINHIVNVFGSKRIMWGSDWPVVNVKSDFSSWIYLTESMLNRFPEQDIINIFIQTACDFYNLDLN